MSQSKHIGANQQTQETEMKPQYDFVVCGSGSSGSVVARRLAENPEVSVLLLEAGGSDKAPEVTDAARWTANIGSERDWGFRTRPNPHLNGRSLLWSMGKVLGGGSSINGMTWARGHRNDWDHFAAETGETGWSYDSVLAIYRRIEDWHGEPDPKRRGSGGLLFVQPEPDPNPIAPAMVEAARSVGIPTFADHNGVMMEGEGGAALMNVLLRDGQRVSIYRSYVHPYLDRPNLTVLTHALVTRVIFEGKRAIAVEVLFDGKVHRVGAGREIVLSLGAINTPKVLMQSGVGDEQELRRVGIDVVQHLPGVGQNLQDHLLFAGCIWEYEEPLPPRNNGAEAVSFWKSDLGLDTPDLMFVQVEYPLASPMMARLDPQAPSWAIYPAVMRPQSRGRLRLTGASPSDPLDIDANTMSDPADMKAMLIGVRLCREIGNSTALRPFTQREIMPGDLRGPALEHFVGDGIIPYYHQTCSAKMGRDSMSVVDGQLQVYGIENLRIADGSIMPRVTTGNTMAPCVIIGERAAEMIRKRHGL
ncbi:GMC family oxidoreductase N-terminal domain-containing protein [Sorangium sp. So ce726]|uniref:GMC family oxidoreductase n=1 Tax=Sorangium sp. So ce726 TaxID=3133319 RepID=UPI003F5E6F13